MINVSQNICSYLKDYQQRLIQVLEIEEPDQKFREDLWQYESGGGGRSCVLEQGAVIEKAAVNFSNIQGHHLPPSALKQQPALQGKPFQAMGVSTIVHPRNPYVPTSHFNIRFLTTLTEEPIWWFGGGFDLTPYYGFVEDCQHWHRTAKKACENFGDDIYPRFKKACDQYFFLPHRQEARGIGGLFFDYFREGGFEQAFALAQSIAEHYILAYQPILQRRKNILYKQEEREFQTYRRGRYVEFNLLYDRGTLFGLQSGGRTESILASLPPEVSWRYNWQPAPGSKEAELYTRFLPAQDWIT